jgi:phosphoribosylglycinamide formyltransferase-1
MKIAVLISGRGSNLKAMIEDSKRFMCPYEIALVIADKNCDGLNYAYMENIPVRIVNYAEFNSKESAENKIDGHLYQYDVDLVVLAGFMKLFTPYLITRWYGRIINIHPSLLPSFRGLNTHERAIKTGVKFHGVTVHYVDEGTDTGPIIAQRCVPVWPIYTPNTLADRVLEEEHELLPTVIRMIALNKIALKNNKVVYYNIEDGNV